MDMNRCYSLLNVKSIDEDAREIEGVATTPEPDRVGDIINPLGAQFKNPVPLLWQHRHDSPVGTVRFDRAKKDGITFKARLPKIAEAGPLKDLVDMAWQAVKAELVRGVSIGFRSLKHSYIDSGGILFDETEIVELSLVSVPANASATIHTIKSIDSAHLAASGQQVGGSTVPGDSGKPAAKKAVTVNINRKPEMTTKTVAEQIKGFQDARAAKAAQMEEIMNKSAESGETLDAEQSEQYDTLESEVEAIDKHLKRLDALEKAQAVKAVAPVVVPAPGVPAGAATPRVTIQKDKAPGIPFAQYARCLALSHLHHRDPVTIARSMYPDDSRISTLLEKAAVAAGNTINDSWAGNLVSDEGAVFADFVEFLRPQTILGRFGADGIPSLRQVPFRTPLVGQSSGGSGYWVGEGKAKPLTKFDFTRSTLDPLKVANIAVATRELLRDSSPSADLIIRDSLAAALRERLDLDFIDPSKAAAAGVSPASVLNGVSGIPSVGSDADSVRCDVRAVFAQFIAANNAPTSGVWIMPATAALALSMMQNPLGQNEFPGLTMNGGTFHGLPVIVSEYVPVTTSGAIVALVNAQDIYLADDGGISIDMSTEASLQMDDAPTNASVDGVSSDSVQATQLVSLWQTNSVGFLAERTINWSRRRSSSVAYLTGVNWGACAS